MIQISNVLWQPPGHLTGSRPQQVPMGKDNCILAWYSRLGWPISFLRVPIRPGRWEGRLDGSIVMYDIRGELASSFSRGLSEFCGKQGARGHGRAVVIVVVE